MKKLMIYACVLLPTMSMAQVTLYNANLTDTTLTVLYASVPNKIKITGASSTRLTLTAAVGNIQPDPDSDYTFEYSCAVYKNKPEYDTLRLYDRNKLVLTAVMELKHLAKPIASLANSINPVITSEQLEANPVVGVFCNDFYNYGFYVMGFELHICPETGDPTMFEYVAGTRLTPEQLSKIKNLQENDFIRLQNVMVNCSTCTMKSRLKPVEIKIK